MSYSEIADLLDTIATMTEAPAELDDAIAVNWFGVALEVHTLVTVAKAQVEAEIDVMYAHLIAEHEDAEDDAIRAGWGHD